MQQQQQQQLQQQQLLQQQQQALAEQQQHTAGSTDGRSGSPAVATAGTAAPAAAPNPGGGGNGSIVDGQDAAAGLAGVPPGQAGGAAIPHQLQSIAADSAGGMGADLATLKAMAVSFAAGFEQLQQLQGVLVGLRQEAADARTDSNKARTQVSMSWFVVGMAFCLSYTISTAMRACTCSAALT